MAVRPGMPSCALDLIDKHDTKKLANLVAQHRTDLWVTRPSIDGSIDSVQTFHRVTQLLAAVSHPLGQLVRLEGLPLDISITDVQSDPASHAVLGSKTKHPLNKSNHKPSIGHRSPWAIASRAATANSWVDSRWTSADSSFGWK